MAVVDASVVISALISSEPYHERSKAWLDSLVNSGGRFAAPTILLSEVAAPLGRVYNQPELAKQIVSGLLAAPFAELVPVSTPIAYRAAIIAADYQIRGCDAVYVALAEILGEELITLDRTRPARYSSSAALNTKALKRNRFP